MISYRALAAPVRSRPKHSRPLHRAQRTGVHDCGRHAARIHLPGGSGPVWAPLVTELADIRGPSLPDFVEGREASVLHVIGRLNPNIDLGQARADLDRVIRELATEHGRPASATAELTPLVDDLLGSVRIGLWTLLQPAVGLLMVAAIANVAGLMLVQVSRQRRRSPSAWRSARRRAISPASCSSKALWW